MPDRTLSEAYAQQRRKVRMPYEQKVRALLVAVGTIVAILMLVSAYHLASIGLGSATRANVNAASLAAAQRLSKYVEQRRTLMADIAARPGIIRSFQTGRGRELQEQLIRREVPDSIDAMLIGSEIEDIEPARHPRVNFNELALMFAAKLRGEVPGPRFTLGASEPRVSFAAPVYAGEGSPPLGYTVVSFPFAEVEKALGPYPGRPHYFELRQGRRGAATAGLTSGALPYAARPDIEPIEGTQWHIAYAPDRGLLVPPFSNPWVSAAALVLAPLLFFGLATLFRTRDKREEQRLAEPTAAELAEIERRQAEDKTKISKDQELLEKIRSVSAKAKAPAKKIDVKPEIFRAYDIRGIVGKTLDAEVVRLIGKAVGSEARDRGQHKIAVGRDGRLSGPEMSKALIEGITSTGIDVIDVGAVPTPVVYFAAHSLETHSAVAVTGSHNPPDYNGFKIVLGGETLAAEAIQGLFERIRKRAFADGNGTVRKYDVLDDYIEQIASDVQVEEPLRVVVDCGNGIAGVSAPSVLEEIGCEVLELHCEVDGTFPNHHPDPGDPKNLQDLIRMVESTKADLGVAFDGDGDRLGVVTAEGEVIYPDRLLMLFAEDVLMRQPGAAIIYDVKCTGELSRVIVSHGGSPIMWKTGHSLIKAKMRETNAELAGEMSGHFFFRERWFGFDDGVYAAARLLEILGASGSESPTERLNQLPSAEATPELKVELEEGENFAFLKSFQEQASFPDARVTDIDGVRADYADGWGLVRCSNTTPTLVLRFEAENKEALQRIQEEFRRQMLAVRDDLRLPF